MQKQLNTDTAVENSNLPVPSGYQARIIDQVSTCVLRDDLDALVVAPTGSGKTLMFSNIGKNIADADEDAVVLILTHRLNLHAQMSGDPKGATEKDRLGQVRWSTGMEPGTIADQRNGGVNLNSQVLVCMVGSTANFLDKNPDAFKGKKVYVIGDEIHHSSESAESRENQGDYAKVQELLPGSKLIGFTATDYRGDGDKLHPRLEKAPRFLVAVEETVDAKRTVEAKTILSKAKLSNGMTPNQTFEDFDRKGEKKQASAEIKRLKDAAYYDACLDDWDRHATGKQTIAFTDGVGEIDDVTDAFNDRFGPGTAVKIASELGKEHNEAAMKAYREGRAKVLVSCKMIGEGFDVPATDCVMSFNSSITRGDMNQYVGRAVRAADGKEHGLFIDCGTGTARHGKIEEQHKVQSVRAHAMSRRKSQEIAAIGKAAPVKSNGWHAVPGGRQTIFFKRQSKGDFRVFVLRKNLMKDEGRTVRKGVDAGRGMGVAMDRYDRPLFSMKELGSLIGEHLQVEAGYISRAGGMRGKVYHAKARKELEQWRERLAKDVAPEKNPVKAQRSALVMAAIRNDQKAAVGAKALFENLKKLPKDEAMRETLRLSGVAFRELSVSDELPLGDREQLNTLGRNMCEADYAEMPEQKLAKEAAMTGFVLNELASKGLSKNAKSMVTGLSERLQGQDIPLDRRDTRTR